MKSNPSPRSTQTFRGVNSCFTQYRRHAWQSWWQKNKHIKDKSHQKIGSKSIHLVEGKIWRKKTETYPADGRNCLADGVRRQWLLEHRRASSLVARRITARLNKTAQRSDKYIKQLQCTNRIVKAMNSRWKWLGKWKMFQRIFVAFIASQHQVNGLPAKNMNGELRQH